MAIVIQTEQPVIPIELGKLSFEFNVSDESVKEFRKNASQIQKELESLKVSNDDDQALEQAKDVLRRGFEVMLGDGSFDAIYKQTPSVILVMKYFSQIGEGIAEELNKMGFTESQQEKAKKYLANKQQSMLHSPLA